jgi:PAS domain S-box-containing protein
VTALADDPLPPEIKQQAIDEAPVGVAVADATAPDMPLVYVNETFERVTGYSAAESLGRNCRFLQGPDTDTDTITTMRRAIEAGESFSAELRNYTQDGEIFWNEIELAPLRNAGGDITHFVGFQNDVTARKEAQLAADQRAEELAAERAALQTLLDRIDGVIADVTEIVVDATDRETLEAEVCACLGEVYTAAWLGAYDLATETVEPTHATDDDHRPQAIALADDNGDATAAAVREAVSTGRVCTTSSADHADGIITAAVPLTYGETTYGVACVYTDADTFADNERPVLEALGRTIATGINAAETQRALRATQVVDLELAVPSLDLGLAALIDEHDCTVAFAGAITHTGADPSLLFEITGCPASTVAETLSEAAPAATLLAERDQGALVELGAERSFFDALDEHGATLEDCTVDAEATRIRLQLPRESLARSLVERLQSDFEPVSVLAIRERERSGTTHRSFVEDLQAELTDRQLTALTKAYASGYFEWPHEVSGEDLAASMGVSRPTFHQHLRAAQRKLAAAVLDSPS